VRRLIIGIGNPDRGDDGVGHAVVRRLEGRVPPDVALLRRSGEAATLVDDLAGAAAVWLIDAAGSAGAPETIRRFDAAAGALPSALGGVSSHGFGLAQAIELARTLGTLPESCVVYAIEGSCYDPGRPLTPEVARAAATVAERILAELNGGGE
jgi:hydrogenase maturation protease